MTVFKKGLLPILVLLLGSGLAFSLSTNPEAARKSASKVSSPLLVDTATPDFGPFVIQVEAMGQVIPARQIELKPQTTGTIVVATDEFIPGGRYAAGEFILATDQQDYLLSVQRQQALLAQAEAKYELELGQQQMAKREMALLTDALKKSIKNPGLALREPQLKQAVSEVKLANADLEAAQLALQRTKVYAPFNAVIVSTSTALGDVISSASTLATLVSTDEYWIDVSLSLDDLEWLRIPQNKDQQGSLVKINAPAGDQHRGRLLKLNAALDPTSRLAQVLVQVVDPLGLAKNNKNTGQRPLAPLMLFDYVSVTFETEPKHHLLRIPLRWLRDGDLWLYQEGQLVIRKINVVYMNQTYAFIDKGLQPSDLVITSNIRVPVAGMRLSRSTMTGQPHLSQKGSES